MSDRHILEEARLSYLRPSACRPLSRPILRSIRVPHLTDGVIPIAAALKFLPPLRLKIFLHFPSLLEVQYNTHPKLPSTLFLLLLR